jgi:hypothetical protein
MRLEMNDFQSISQYNKWDPYSNMDFKVGPEYSVAIGGPDRDGDIQFKVVKNHRRTFDWYIGFQKIMVIRWLDNDREVKFMIDGKKKISSDYEYMQKIIDYLKKLGQNNFEYIPFDDPADGLDTFDEDDMLDI